MLGVVMATGWCDTRGFPRNDMCIAIRTLTITLFVLGALTACTTGGPFAPVAHLVANPQAVTFAASVPADACQGAALAAPAPASDAYAATSLAGRFLNTTVYQVRHEAGITSVAIDLGAYKERPDTLFKEATHLRDLKAEQLKQRQPASSSTAASALGVAAAPATAKAGAPVTQPTAIDPFPVVKDADDIENVLLTLLPDWVGEPDVSLPGLQATARSVAQQATNGATAPTLPDEATNALTAGLSALQLAADKGKPLNTLVSAAGKRPAGDSAQSVRFDRSDHKSLFAELQSIEAFRTFHFLTLVSAARLDYMLNQAQQQRPPSLTNDEFKKSLATELRIFNWSRFLSTYFDAYFRGGHFLQVTDGKNTVVAAGSTGFVTRAGLSVQFSGVDYALNDESGKLSLHHTYPQVTQFGPQLVRVFMEGIFDANGLSPKGVANSTACSAKLFDSSDCLTTVDNSSKTSSAAKDESVTQDIDAISSASESLSTAATGAIIRGVNVVALNNEAVAQVLETLVGVTSRKISEKLLYLTITQDGNTTCPAKASTAPLTVE